MVTMTIRNLPDSVHRRVRLLAAERGISTEAAVRELLDKATRPSEKLGDLLVAYARKHGTDAVETLRDVTPVKPVDF